ncbi:MAG: isochorismatase hydrolase [Chloroflexi bacterium]|nr:isochorismatase hydrolase [Chloroflexota bacterium]
MNSTTTASRDALLVMDAQQGIVQRIGYNQLLLGNLAAAISAARASGIPVIYVVVRFRNGYPEISERNRAFAAVRSAGAAMEESSPATAIHPAVEPRDGDIVVTKRRVGAFSGSDLDVVLRGQQVDGLVLTGIATSGVVLSTLRLAADLDFRCTVLTDCCADTDEEVHRVLITKVFPRQADVLTVEDWAAGLQTTRGATAQ